MREGSIKFTSDKALNIKADENEGKKSIWKPNNYCFLTAAVIYQCSIIYTKWPINTSASLSGHLLCSGLPNGKWFSVSSCLSFCPWLPAWWGHHKPCWLWGKGETFPPTEFSSLLTSPPCLWPIIHIVVTYFDSFADDAGRAHFYAVFQIWQILFQRDSSLHFQAHLSSLSFPIYSACQSQHTTSENFLRVEARVSVDLGWILTPSATWLCDIGQETKLLRLLSPVHRADASPPQGYCKGEMNYT